MSDKHECRAGAVIPCIYHNNNNNNIHSLYIGTWHANVYIS